MSEPTNEAGLVRVITKEIARAWPASVVYKIHGGPQQEVGIPDLLVIVSGRLVGIEVKYQRPGESRKHALGRVSAVQSRQIERLRSAGAVAGPALSVGDAFSLIEEALALP